MVLLALEKLYFDLGELRCWSDKLNNLIEMLRFDFDCFECINNQILIKFLLLVT